MFREARSTSLARSHRNRVTVDTITVEKGFRWEQSNTELRYSISISESRFGGWLESRKNAQRYLHARTFEQWQHHTSNTKWLIVFPITKKKIYNFHSIFKTLFYSIRCYFSRFISFRNYQRRSGSSFGGWTSSSSDLHISYICHKFDRRECTHWSCGRQNSGRRYKNTINILKTFIFI